jgi:hypothetical protein
MNGREKERRTERGVKILQIYFIFLKNFIKKSFKKKKKEFIV